MKNLKRGEIAYRCNGCGQVFAGEGNMVVSREGMKSKRFCKKCSLEVFSNIELLKQLLELAEDKSKDGGMEVQSD